MGPLRIANLLPLPTPVRLTNSSVLATPGVQPSLVPRTDISVNTLPDKANTVDNQAGKNKTSGWKKHDEQSAKREEVVASRKISRSQFNVVKKNPVACDEFHLCINSHYVSMASIFRLPQFPQKYHF
jgi:hypothetical protein